MDSSEKALARHLFQNKIYKADGQSFEDLFTRIMNYYDIEFQQIKPWGNIGDRKNDGYIRPKGIFFQVYAPEDIRKSYTNVINKLQKDFDGLKDSWPNIREFYFVVNDKYKGVNPDCELILQEIQELHGLDEARFLTAKDLENRLFTLDDDQITSIAGFGPDPLNVKKLDYSVLDEVVDHIMHLPLGKDEKPITILPEWDDKIKFNMLSGDASTYLNNGCSQLCYLKEYLDNNSDFLADSLRDKMNEIYNQEKQSYSGNDLFWAILRVASPKAESMYEIATIVIMSKYFETCDIFEGPIYEELDDTSNKAY